MNTQKIFLCALSMLCCFSAVNANESVERIVVGERALSDCETVALYEARLNSYKADEEQNEGQEKAKAEALQTAPFQEILAASRVAKAQFQQENEKNERIAKKGITTNPNVFHYSLGFNGSSIELEDGSGWKIYSGDLYLTKNWLTTANSLIPDTIVIEPNQNWPTYSNFRYLLTNQQTAKTIRTNLHLAPLFHSAYRRYIHTYTIFVDVFGYQYVQLCLNDGSIWNMLTNDHPITSLWQVHDTVIMGCNNGPYSAIAPNILININTNNWAASACVAY